MRHAWTGPHRSCDDRNPYVDWWWTIKETGPNRQSLFKLRSFALLSSLASTDSDRQSRFKKRPLPRPSGLTHFQGTSRTRAKEEFGGGTSVPIPAHALGKELKDLPDWSKSDFPGPEPDIPDDLVIVGIIDTGIALGHRRFRRKNGGTRFLAAWQQTSEWAGQKDLPFGQELYHDGIDELLCQHSGGTLDGRLDEEAFNRAAHLVEPGQQVGQRDLDYRSAHGTHVLDLATGFDPARTDDATLDRHRIVAVNLPPQYVHGSAGNFLGFFAIFALERILRLADALWRRKNPKKEKGGYPVVVNFSYGMNAGPKDGNSSWERAIQQLLSYRNNEIGAATRLVMPVGNENVDRGAAVTLMGKGEFKTKEDAYELKTEVTLPWRIGPSDQTSNFVEIWGRVVSQSDPPGPGPDQFQVFVTPPGLPRRLPVPTLQPGEHACLESYARVYRPRTGLDHPLQLVICVAPTLRYTSDPTAPAGPWEITVRYDEEIPVDVAFYVQSDQAAVRHGKTGGQSYFDHPCYGTHRDDGRPRDSFDYETRENEEPWDEQGPVQRKGTHNALSTTPEVIVVGGYRRTDGRPALYSATANGGRWGRPGRKAITALYPTEDGAAHFGLLAAGSRDGSVATFRGTSMAAAEATRHVAAELAEWASSGRSPITDCAKPGWLIENAKAYKAGGRPAQYRNVDGLKGGAGHLPSIPQGRVPRLRKP